MAPDGELIEKELEYKRARRAYLADRWFSFFLYAVFFWTVILLVGVDWANTGWETSLLIGATVAGSIFFGDWISAVVFKRKSRPWRLRRHPDDAKPTK